MRRIAFGTAFCLLVSVMPVMAATADEIANYEVEGISLSKSIDDIKATLKEAGYNETPPAILEVSELTWTFEKSLDDGGSASFVVTTGEGHVTSIRYDIKYRSVKYDVKAEYRSMSELAGEDADRCKLKRGETAECSFTVKKGEEKYSFSYRVQPHHKILKLDKK